jgi:hypothetical protein
MAVSFLTAAQRARYGRYPEVVTPDDLARCFHLSDDDRAQIESCRGHHNRLGFALQLSTVRYLGTFLEDPIAVPSSVLQFVSRQLAIHTTDGLERYRDGEQREEHVTKIRKHYGYGDIAEPRVGFRMTRWLYGVCWTGTERLGALFERATAWLLAHKILLPGVTTMERFVVSVRARVEARLYGLLSRGLTAQQKEQLQRLLLVPDGDRVSVLDQIRSGPTRISGPAIRAAIDRLNAVRALGISIPMKARIPSSRIASLARFANRAKAQAISRMPELRRLATLVAFVHCLEATAQDEVLEVLEMQMNDLFGKAITADQKARLRALKDLDESALALAEAEACHLLLDPELPDESLRQKVFAKIPRAALENALERVTALIRPPDDIYYQELSKHYRSVRGYLPHVLTHISFEAAPAGRPLLAACDWLRNQQDRNKPDNDAPREFIDKAWQRYVVQKDGRVDLPAYTFCVLKHLQTAIHRRDVFIRSALITRGIGKNSALPQWIVANLELSTIGKLKAVHNLFVAKCKLNQFHGFSKCSCVELGPQRRGSTSAISVNPRDCPHTRLQDPASHCHRKVRINGVGICAHFERRAKVIESRRTVPLEDREEVELLVQFESNR